MKELTPQLRSWASVIDENTVAQALVASRLPILAGPIALMPDAHLGIGATIGSVIATDAAIIPSAVGVDIGSSRRSRRTSRPAWGGGTRSPTQRPEAGWPSIPTPP